jgi:hypothetical protein
MTRLNRFTTVKTEPIAQAELKKACTAVNDEARQELTAGNRVMGVSAKVAEMKEVDDVLAKALTSMGVVEVPEVLAMVEAATTDMDTEQNDSFAMFKDHA